MAIPHKRDIPDLDRGQEAVLNAAVERGRNNEAEGIEVASLNLPKIFRNIFKDVPSTPEVFTAGEKALPEKPIDPKLKEALDAELEAGVTPEAAQADMAPVPPPDGPVTAADLMHN